MALPRDETGFFGRIEEMAEIERRLGAVDSGRLVTLVGLGGIGKSRLALEAASSRPPASEHVVVYAPLAESRSLGEAVRAIANAVPGGESTSRRRRVGSRATLDTVVADLERTGPDGTLLVLENLERLGADAAALVGPLLDRCPRLRILATSREPVGVKGEQRIVLSPMAEADAVALLRDRARSANADADAIDDEEARAIVERVDRLPLAIELAASRLEVLSPAELLRRLTAEIGGGPAFDVLADATGTTPPMHRTMRAALDGSWDLLRDVERSVLVQASVFAAPFGIDAAEDVIALGEVEVLSVIESLVKRSLLYRIAKGGRARIGMFETVKSWARGKLGSDTSITADDVVLRHARYHLREAESAASQAYGEGAVASLDRLEDLLPELSLAFEAVRSSEPAIAARIALSLADLALFRGPNALQPALFVRACAAAEQAGDERLLARTLVVRARIDLDGGRITDAEAALRRALELAAKSGDDLTTAEATRSLGWALSALGRPADAEATLRDAERMHRAQGSTRGLADSQVALGIARALQGQSKEGLAHLRAALALHVEHGDVIRQEKVLGFAGLVGHEAREVARGLPRDVLARAPRSSLEMLPTHVAEALATAESASANPETGASWRAGLELYRNGVAAYDRADCDEAIASFERAIQSLERAGVEQGRAVVHSHMAVAYARLGDRAEATAHLERARAAPSDPVSELIVSVFGAAALAIADGRPPAGAEDLLQRVRRAELGTVELAIAARVLEQALAEPPADAAPLSLRSRAVYLLGPEARWFEPPGQARVDLVRYGPVRRLLDRLVVARLAQPGVALSADALIEAGWPGERMRHTAGLLRVYSAVRRLRRLGLGPILVTRDDGYLIDPRAIVERAEA
jgi:predicted ATPase